jgi:predicted dehydrogenase
MTFRVGLVGCGSIAAELEDLLRAVPGYFLFPYGHATLVARHPRTELVAIADPDPRRREAIGDRFNVAARFADHHALLESVPVDIVAVAAPTRFHARIAIDAAHAGVKGLFLEKPVAETLRDVDAMIAACTAAGTATVVNHFRSFDPLWRRAAQLVQSGEVGRLTGITAVWVDGVADGGSHLLDYLRVMTGARVTWVQAFTQGAARHVDPGGTFILGLDSDIRVTVHMEWGSKAPPQVDVFGTAGMVRLGNFQVQRWRFEEVADRVVPVEVPFPGRHDGRSAMTVALDELLDAIEYGTRPVSTLEDGRDVLGITLAVLEAGRTGCRVDLPFIDLDAAARAES